MDINRFMNSRFEDRTEDVDVPELKEFFDEDKKPVWKIRALSGVEYGKIQELLEADEAIVEMLRKITSKDSESVADGILNYLGRNEEVSKDTKRRYHILIKGSVDPEIDITFAVRLAENYCMTFYNLTNRIVNLTGKGKKLGK
jgi:hypothetical protein